jgi:hypothetical protein
MPAEREVEAAAARVATRAEALYYARSAILRAGLVRAHAALHAALAASASASAARARAGGCSGVGVAAWRSPRAGARLRTSTALRRGCYTKG